MDSPSATAFAPDLRGSSVDWEQVTLQRLPHAFTAFAVRVTQVRTALAAAKTSECGFVLVVSLAAKKRLFLNVRWERLLVSLSGKKVVQYQRTACFRTIQVSPKDLRVLSGAS